MSELVSLRSGEVIQYDPTQAAPRVAAIDAARKYAQRIRNWDALDAAIDNMIAEQRAFIAWWTATVSTRSGNPGIADQQSLISVEVATRETHITASQVSRWRKALDDEDDYRLKLRQPSYKKALAEVGKRQKIEEPEESADLNAEEADEAIKKTAGYLRNLVFNPPSALRVALKGAMARAAPRDVKAIAAAAKFLAELMEASK